VGGAAFEGVGATGPVAPTAPPVRRMCVSVHRWGRHTGPPLRRPPHQREGTSPAPV